MENPDTGVKDGVIQCSTKLPDHSVHGTTPSVNPARRSRSTLMALTYAWKATVGGRVGEAAGDLGGVCAHGRVGDRGSGNLGDPRRPWLQLSTGHRKAMHLRGLGRRRGIRTRR